MSNLEIKHEYKPLTEEEFYNSLQDACEYLKIPFDKNCKDYTHFLTQIHLRNPRVFCLLCDIVDLRHQVTNCGLKVYQYDTKSI